MDKSKNIFFVYTGESWGLGGEKQKPPPGEFKKLVNKT